MFDNIIEDYARYGCKSRSLVGIPLRCAIDAGFRAVILHRVGNWFCRRRLRIVAKMIECLMHHLCHCWIGSTAEIGPGFLIGHVCGLVIADSTVIGRHCDVRQNVTLGGNYNKTDAEGRFFPILGNNVSLGAGAVVIGPVKVGDNSIVGANSVVNRDVPENVIVAGNPAKVIRERWPECSGRRL
jgi:serine O-acetyltransferase